MAAIVPPTNGASGMLASHPDLRLGPAPAARRSLEGRVALVTGSTSGIGLGIARSLAAEGADLVLNGLGEHEAFTGLCRDLSSRHGVRVDLVISDLGQPAAVAATVDKAVAEFGFRVARRNVAAALPRAAR